MLTSGVPHKVAWLLLLALFSGQIHPRGNTNSTARSMLEHCPPLPPATGNTVLVSSVAELQQAVDSVPANTTILIADGVYNLDGVLLHLDVPNVTLRSASGNREAVVLDGNYLTTEIVQVAASDVTLADLTLREAYYHPVHVMSSTAGHTLNTLIYNVHILDPGQQAVKINPDADGYYPDYGEIACSHIELTEAGRPHVWEINGSCYTGGVDAHQALGWEIRDNLVQGFWCDQGLSEHAIHFWRGWRDTTVERNILRDNARGVGFGLVTSGTARSYPDNPCPSAEGSYVDHYDGVIRNNFIFAGRGQLFDSQYGFDCGICLWNACGVTAVHNSVASTQAPFSSIEWRFDNTYVDIANNLVTHNLRDRGGSAYLTGNLAYQQLTFFVSGADGDLHLVETASAAIDQGSELSETLINDDIDGDRRPIGSGLDIGADEYGTSAPDAVVDLHITDAFINEGTLTVTVGWTPPAQAITTTIRYSATVISPENWGSASPLTGNLPGNARRYTTTLPYDGNTTFFSLKTQNLTGDWSELSNNAFWLYLRVYLPLIAP